MRSSPPRKTRVPYECDGLTLFRELPSAVLLPENEAQVVVDSEALLTRRASRSSRAVQGPASPGARVPERNGVVLSLAKFKRILAIDPLARTATVQPGVRNLAISEAAAPYGLYYAPDPSSQIACTIGGNVAENAGGVHCLKYGLTVHNLRRVRAVLITGEVIEFGAEALDAPGYDLLALITGSEGLLAVITEVTREAQTQTAEAKCVMAAFDDIAKAGSAVAADHRRRHRACGARDDGSAHDQRGRALRPRGLPHGRRRDSALRIRWRARGGSRRSGCDQCADDANAARRASKYRATMSSATASGPVGRPRSPPRGASRRTTTACDGTIPRRALGQVLTRIAELSQEFGLPCMNVFHAGDGNLHPLILYDANRAGDVAKTLAFGAKILELCIEAGGTITGEHGVGVEKLGEMCVQFAPNELERFHDDQARVRRGGSAQPRQGRADAASVRGDGPHARAPRRAPHPELPRF